MNAYQLQVKARALRYDVVTFKDIKLGCSWRYIPGCYGDRENPPEDPEANLVNVIRLDTCTSVALDDYDWYELEGILVGKVNKERELEENEIDKALTALEH